MPNTTLAKSTDIPIPRGSSSPAGGAFRGPAIPAGLGGTIMGWVSNGATGPTVAGFMNVYASAKADGTAPAVPAVGAPVPGTDWYLIGFMSGGSLVANDTRALLSCPVRAEHQFIFVELTGNTGQAVTGDARYARIDAATTT